MRTGTRGGRIDAALLQIPDEHRHGTPILIRTDGAGCSKAFLAHIRGLREGGVASEFSVGWAITERERAAITAVPEHIWAAAIDTDGRPRDSAAVAEITDLLPAAALADHPNGTRVIVRRERPHPGAQLSLFEEADGWRYTAFATDTPAGQLAFLDARHRAHARVKDRIRTGKDTDLGRSARISQWILRCPHAGQSAAYFAATGSSVSTTGAGHGPTPQPITGHQHHE